MNTIAEITETYQTLRARKRATLSLDGFEIEVKCPQSGELEVLTPVFHGGNYVPKSVRSFLDRGHGAHDSTSRVDLFIDEENFRVMLSLTTPFPGQNEGFEDLMLDYIGLAEEWRILLDEYGQQDLIHVPNR